MGPQVSHIKYCNLYAGTTNVRYIHVYIVTPPACECTRRGQRRLDTVITLRNVNTIFADAAIYPPLKMYGSFEVPLGVKPSEDGRRLVASYTHLSLNTKKIAGTPPPPQRFRELRRQILELL